MYGWWGTTRAMSAVAELLVRYSNTWHVKLRYLLLCFLLFGRCVWYWHWPSLSLSCLVSLFSHIVATSRLSCLSTGRVGMIRTTALRLGLPLQWVGDRLLLTVAGMTSVTRHSSSSTSTRRFWSITGRNMWSTLSALRRSYKSSLTTKQLSCV